MRTLQSEITKFITLINESIIPFLFILAFILFLYGVMMYIFKYDDSKRREDGIKMMTYGIIGLFVMFSVWGLVTLLVDLIKPSLSDSKDLVIPQF